MDQREVHEYRRVARGALAEVCEIASRALRHRPEMVRVAQNGVRRVARCREWNLGRLDHEEGVVEAQPGLLLSPLRKEIRGDFEMLRECSRTATPIDAVARRACVRRLRPERAYLLVAVTSAREPSPSKTLSVIVTGPVAGTVWRVDGREKSNLKPYASGKVDG